MTVDTPTKVDAYLLDLLVGPDPDLAACAAHSSAQGLPEIQVTPLQGQLLFLVARAMKARRILEIGTLGGYSTISLARAVSPGGLVVTCELEPHNAEVARQNLSRAGVGDVVTVRIGAALDTLAEMVREQVEPFDFIFIDADKVNMPGYFELSMQLAKQGALLVFDNVIRDGEVVNAASTDPSVTGVRKLMEMLSTDPRVVSTALQTVGAKGYDGFAFALVTA